MPQNKNRSKQFRTPILDDLRRICILSETLYISAARMICLLLIVSMIFELDLLRFSTNWVVSKLVEIIRHWSESIRN